MTELVTLVVILAVSYSAYRQAQALGEWSWAAFGCILLLAALCAAGVAFMAIEIATRLGPDNALAATALLLLLIGMMVTGLAIVAKQVQNRFRKRA